MELQKRVSLKDFTTIGCGGIAKEVLFPDTETEFLEECSYSNRLLLGRGSNILPSDAECSRTIICTKKMLNIQRSGNEVYAECGVSVAMLLRFCLKEKLTGLEFLAGIPGSVGGILMMNAGACAQSVSERINEVHCIQDGEIRSIKKEDCFFSYRSSIFQEKKVPILGGVFRLEEATKEEIRNKIHFFLEKRKYLPKGKSMGCIFRNPPGQIAGVLVQLCGLSGRRIGGAIVSSLHGNFIINLDHAASDEVKELILLMKNVVLEEFGIDLKEEIIYWNYDKFYDGN